MALSNDSGWTMALSCGFTFSMRMTNALTTSSEVSSFRLINSASFAAERAVICCSFLCPLASPAMFPRFDAEWPRNWRRVPVWSTSVRGVDGPESFIQGCRNERLRTFFFPSCAVNQGRERPWLALVIRLATLRSPRHSRCRFLADALGMPHACRRPAWPGEERNPRARRVPVTEPAGTGTSLFVSYRSCSSD